MADTNLKIAVVLSAVDKMSSVINSATSGSISNLNKFSQKANAVADKAYDVGRKAGAMGLAIAAPLGLAVKAAEESEIANKRLENIFKSMGDATGKAAKEAEAYASKLQMVIGVEDEEIQAAQAKIATFGKVSSATARMAGIFDRATNAAFDMASAGFGDAAGNAVQLGKALEDPIKGITALAKSGVTFTAQEKNKIKTLVESGKHLEAQKIVLKVIEKQVGGTAKATATTSAKAKAAFGEVAESVGRILLPQVNALMNKIIPVLNKVIKWIEENPKLAQTVAFVAAGLAALCIVVSAVSFVVGACASAVAGLGVAFEFLMANPIILFIAAIAAAAYAIYKNWGKIKQFFIDLWEGVKNVFKKVWDWIKSFFENMPIIGDIIKNWDKIKAYFSSIWDNVKKKFVDFFVWLDGVPKRMYNAGVNIVKSIWEGIKSFINKPIDMIKNMVTKIREYLPFSPAKVGPLRDIHKIRLVETIAENIKPNALTKAMKVTTAAAMVAVTPMAGKAAGNISGSSGGGANVNYSPNITIMGGSPTAKEDFKKMLKDHEKDITKLIEEANRKANRGKL